MTELISISEMPIEVKKILLEKLEYSMEGKNILDKDKQIVKDRYTGQVVSIDNMLIFPGSAIILDDNPLSVSAYLEEFGDVL
jgi:hypothetical protein